MQKARRVQIKKSDDKPVVAELTDIVTQEVSVVDRAANKRTFLVTKKTEIPEINPLLVGDKSLADLDAADAAAYKAQKESSEGKDSASVSAPEVITDGASKVAVVETPAVDTAAVKSNSEEQAVEKARCSECSAMVSASELKAGVCQQCGAAISKSSASISVSPVTPTTIVVEVEEPKPEPVKLHPRVHAAVQAGLNEMLARIQDALKALSEVVVDAAGEVWVPWSIYTKLDQAEALSRGLQKVGGPSWVADATIASAAVQVTSAATDAITKAGAPMASARLKKFLETHGEMTTAIKALGGCHKAMGDMLKELEPVSKEEAVSNISKESTTVVVVKPVDNKNIELEKTVAELQGTIALQAAQLQKAQQPQSSNALTIDVASASNATINKNDAVVWPLDLANDSNPRAGRRFE